MEDYLRLSAARYSHSTIKNEAHVLRRFIAVTSDLQVRHLSLEHVERFFYGSNGVMAEHQTGDGLDRAAVQASTHNYYRGRLKAFFAYCTQRD